MFDDLGEQTVHLTPRTKVRFGEHVDGPTVDYPGCAVQPVQSEERRDDGEASESRWKIIAPVGFPERTTNVATVDGIVDDAGRPRRLQVDGELQTHYDDEGFAVYVGGFLTEWRG